MNEFADTDRDECVWRGGDIFEKGTEGKQVEEEAGGKWGEGTGGGRGREEMEGEGDMKEEGKGAAEEYEGEGGGKLSFPDP